jgi:ABC-2 type transport system permease protein
MSNMKYLLGGSVALAMYVAVMIGGGMRYFDEQEASTGGYLITRITPLELVPGLNLAGTIKAVLSGVCIVVIGSLLAASNVIFNPLTALLLLLLCWCRCAMFGVLNTLLLLEIRLGPGCNKML